MYICPECGVNEVFTCGALCDYCRDKRETQFRNREYEREIHNREFERQMELQEKQARAAKQEEERRTQLIQEQNWILQQQADHDNAINNIKGLTDYFIFYQTHEITLDNFDQVREAWNKADSYIATNFSFDVKTLILKMEDERSKIGSAYKAMELLHKPIDDERKRQKELAEAKAAAERAKAEAEKAESDRLSQIDRIESTYKQNAYQKIYLKTSNYPENSLSDAPKLYSTGNSSFTYSVQTHTATLNIDKMCNMYTQKMDIYLNLYAVPLIPSSEEGLRGTLKILTLELSFEKATLFKCHCMSLNDYSWTPPVLHGCYNIEARLEDDEVYYDEWILGTGEFYNLERLKKERESALKPLLKQSEKPATSYYPNCVVLKNCQCQISTNPGKLNITTGIENHSDSPTKEIKIGLNFSKKRNDIFDLFNFDNNIVCSFEIDPLKAKGGRKITREIPFTRTPEDGNYQPVLYVYGKKEDGTWEALSTEKLSDSVRVGDKTEIKFTDCQCKFYTNPAKYLLTTGIENHCNHDTGKLRIFLCFAKQLDLFGTLLENVSNNNTVCCFELDSIQAKKGKKINREVQFAKSMPAGTYAALLYVEEQCADGSYKYLTTYNTGSKLNWPGN